MLRHAVIVGLLMLSRLILEYTRLVRRRNKARTLAIRFDKNSINFRAIIAAYDDTNLRVVGPVLITRQVAKQR